MAGDPTWYRPVCDQLLAKMVLWLKFYDRGTIAASRKWMSPQGKLVDKVTKYSHKIRMTPLQAQHLARLMEALAEHQELAADFRRIADETIHRGRLLPGGEREMELCFYEADIQEIIDVLTRSKSGKLKTLAQIAEEQKQSGMGAFEL